MTDPAEEDVIPSIRIFGGTGVFADGPISIGGPRQRRLLALLAIRAGSVVTVDWLGEHLWSDEDRPTATDPTLRTSISRLRHALPDVAQAWIRTEPSGYRLDAPPGAVEHQRFAELRAAARDARDAEDPQTALRLLDEALALWRGRPFRELEDLDWASADIAQLELDRLEMFEERWEASLALGRHTQITGELAAFTAEHGLRDRAARQHALALHRCGRTAEALRALDHHRRTLAEASGLDPSREVVELEAALLRGDSSLEVEGLGRPLRGYRLLDQIGAGAFSVVWRATQPSVGREVAVKQIRAELATQPEFIRRFEAEAHLIARIEHPHIVPLIDFWRDPDSAYLVMRQLTGGTLERLLDDGSLGLEQTLELAHQIGGALAAAHAVGVVHRDVKTANILYDEHGNAFLSDFGIALEAAKTSGPEAALSPGSPAYAAPEQIRRERLGPQADIFSLGVVLFECLAGSLPFPAGASADELIDLQLTGARPSLAELRDDVPPAMSAAIARATARTPGERFSTVAEFLDALGGGVSRGRRARGSQGADLVNPYIGLRAFDDGDSDRFHGRDRSAAELLARLDGQSLASRCLVVIGPSGSGKSSLVRAGLLPALRQGAVSGSDRWFTTTMTPGASPFESLEAALLRVAVNPPESLLSRLRSGDRGILRNVRQCLDHDEDVLLLVIDQFEELFTATTRPDCEAFLDALAVAMHDPTTPLRVVITLRADFYHQPLEHRSFAPILKETGITLTPLAPDELEQAIVEPARRAGVDFEPGLVARIVADTTGVRSPLPLLQYALRELFDRRTGAALTVAAYNDIGGMSSALAARAETLYRESDISEQAATRRVFGRLVEPGKDADDIRRRVPVADLGEDAAVLDRYGAARLLTFDRDIGTREPTVEVAHEALLREWPRLVGWLDEDREVLHAVDAIGTAAASWHEGGRTEADLYRGDRLDGAIALAANAPDLLRPIDVEFIAASRLDAEMRHEREARGVRRLRRLVVGVGAALVISLIAAGVAFGQQRRANDEAAAARAARIEADEQRDLAVTAQEEAEDQRNLALEAAREAELATLLSRASALDEEDSTVATLLALEAYRREQNIDTEQALFDALTSTRTANRVATFPPLTSSKCPLGNLSSSGLAEFVTVDGQLVHRDLSTGTVAEVGAASDTCVSWLGDRTLGRRLEWSFDRKTLWFGPFDGPATAVRTFDAPMQLLKTSFRETHVLPFVQYDDGRPKLHLLDDRTGEAVREPISGAEVFVGAADVSLDGSLIAWATHTEDRPGGDGVLLVIDGSDGRVLFEVETAEAVARVAFDPTVAELIALLVDGSLVAVDLTTGRLLHEVQTDLGVRTIELDVRADGAVVAVSAGRVALLDRETGRIAETVEVRAVENSRYRPDGTLLTVTSSDQIEILSLDGTALVDNVWNFPGEVRSIADGYATGLGPDGQVILDLATGEPQHFELTHADGERLRPFEIRGDSGGFVALDARGVSRWEDGRPVSSVELGGEVLGSRLLLDKWLVGTEQDGGTPLLHLVDLARGSVQIGYSVEVPTAVLAGSPTPDGGMWYIDGLGTLRTHDPTGELVSELQTELSSTALAGLQGGDYHPPSGRSVHHYPADAAAAGGVVLVDHRSGATELVVEGEYQAAGFARDGRLLALVQLDGTIRLWDLDRGRALGSAWKGPDVATRVHLWSDEATQSIWIQVAYEIVQIPVATERWAARACEIVGRDFTQDEWDRWVPGDRPPQSACR